MKKSEIKDMLRAAIKPHKLCRVFMKYDVNYRYYFPLRMSEKLFLGAVEDDFILDGFSIRRFRDIVKSEIKDDKCLEIIKAEGILDDLETPPIDVTDWYSVFLSLAKLEKNVIVEKESLDEEQWKFWIGKIVKVCKTKVLLRHFDADGIWEEEPYEIPYSQITSVTFGSRYVDVFSKYV